MYFFILLFILINYIVSLFLFTSLNVGLIFCDGEEMFIYLNSEMVLFVFCKCSSNYSLLI